MASRYSLTVQINPSLPGHAAIVVNEPGRQTFAGFGPKTHLAPWSKGQFDVHTLPAGETPPPDFSSVIGDGHYQSFTVPVTREQAASALAEIGRLRGAGERYNGLNSFSPNVCTTILNRIMEAAGLGRDNLPRVLPSQNGEYLTDIEKTLAADRKAKVVFDGGGFPKAIPQAFRDIQSDYAFVGRGYDTPSERAGHGPTGPQALAADEPTPPADAPSRTDAVPGRYLRSRRADDHALTVFDVGTSPVPFVAPAPLLPRVMAQPESNSANRSAQSGMDAAFTRSTSPWPFSDADASPADMNDWYTRWIKPLAQR
ncbi:hypothetical protein ACRAVF_01105 [Bradyrhizobium oligotrophicum S58]